MRASLLVLASFLAASTAFAAPVNVTDQNGSPAIEGAGTSSTTISVIGGAGSVTVEGGGSLDVHTNSGTVSGQGTVGVPQLGVELGGGFGTGSASENGSTGQGDDGSSGQSGTEGESSNQNSAKGGSADPGTPLGGKLPVGDENAEQPGAGDSLRRESADRGEDSCVTAGPLGDVNLTALARINDPSRINIVLVCGDQRESSSRAIRAIGQNDVLVAALAAYGYAPASVVGVETTSSGFAVLYVSQN